MTPTAVIRKLTIQRFRGLAKFDWHPQPGMNVVLGGGDVGKTTVLEAIALLLSPSNATVVSESDYRQRDSTQEFVIEAVMTLPEDTGIGSQHNFSWPWGLALERIFAGAALTTLLGVGGIDGRRLGAFGSSNIQ